MSEYVLSCCSTADLTKEHFDRRNISYICFHYFLDGKQYPDDLGQSIPFADFYKAMENGADTSTSQINVSEYLAYFTSILEQGKDLLHVSLSSGLSGSVQSATTAAQMAREQFPDRKLYVVDSLAAASGFGLLMDKAADLRDEGKTIDEVIQACHDVGVAIQDGRQFRGPCHLRMNLASPRSRIEEAFRRLDRYVFNP